jgi:hypothetical protein
VDGTYMFCKQESVIQAARLLSRVEGLSLQVCLTTCTLYCLFNVILSNLPSFGLYLKFTGLDGLPFVPLCHLKFQLNLTICNLWVHVTCTLELSSK